MIQINSIDEIKVGMRIRVYYSKTNINNSRYQVRGIVDGTQYVLKYWRKNKRYFDYRLENKYMFELLIHNGNLYKI